MSDLTDLEQDIGDWLGKAASYRSEIDKWKSALQGEYGCWCGPGSRCSEDVDAVDSCCHQHDIAYNALGLDFGSMWSVSAIVKAQAADQALLDCVSGAPEPEDPAGRTYRAVLIDAFRGRLAIAAAATALGSL
jgi:hypothetical protein